MDRSAFIAELDNPGDTWDVVVIGGGATGLGVGVDAAARGYRTLLLEMHDFAKGTSSRSTKLIHGGLRYLQQGDVSLVIEALHERRLLLCNAPHLVSHQSFIVPRYDWWSGPFYGAGLKVYDALAGKLGIKKSSFLSREETLKRIPTLEPEGLRGGIIYYDGQFDDARLAVNLAQTMAGLGGVPINYMQMTGLRKNGGGLIEGVEARDMLSGETHAISARVVINATGIFTDRILAMDAPAHEKIIQCSQGIHIVLDKAFLPGDSAIMVPRTEDSRVLFAVPWHNKVIVGTTETPVAEPELEPVARREEVEYLLRHAARYLARDPQESDVKSVFAGLRPLVIPARSKNISGISRDHHLRVSKSGLVTITGGKWTTYRKMAEEAVDRAALVAGLEVVDCPTRTLRIKGWKEQVNRTDPLYVYGADKAGIQQLMEGDASLAEPLHPDLPYRKAQVIWAVRHEMAQTVEDFLARRTRALLLDARASAAISGEVARIMAGELGRDRQWIEAQTTEYKALAQNYILADLPR